MNRMRKRNEATWMSMVKKTRIIRSSSRISPSSNPMKILRTMTAAFPMRNRRSRVRQAPVEWKLLGISARRLTSSSSRTTSPAKKNKRPKSATQPSTLTLNRPVVPHPTLSLSSLSKMTKTCSDGTLRVSNSKAPSARTAYCFWIGGRRPTQRTQWWRTAGSRNWQACVSR